MKSYNLNTGYNYSNSSSAYKAFIAAGGVVTVDKKEAKRTKLLGAKDCMGTSTFDKGAKFATLHWA